MKITRITAQSFVGLSYLDVTIDKPILLISGPNACGKTSILHAIRYALDDDLCRVLHKKDVKSLTKEGAKNGFVSISIINRDGKIARRTRSVSTGHVIELHEDCIESIQALDMPEALCCLMDHEKITAMTPNVRRGFLFRLMGVSLSGAAIVQRLESRGHSSEHISRVKTQLLSGFPAAHTEAMGIARGLKGQWREVAGTDYGEVKAGSWACQPKPEYNLMAIKNTDNLIQDLSARLGVIQSQRGEAKAHREARARIAERTEELRREAGSLDDAREKESLCMGQVAALDNEVKTLRESIARQQSLTTLEARVTQGLFMRCPECGISLVYSLGECKVGEPSGPEVIRDMESAKEELRRLTGMMLALEAKRTAAGRVLASAQMGVGRAMAAVEFIAKMEQDVTLEDGPIDTPEFDAEHETVLGSLNEAQKALGVLVRAKDEAQAADDKTARAAVLHGEIKALVALAADLAPDGLPAELLGQAMGPINKLLAESAFITGWPRAEISTDELRLGGRPWVLASESEKWRGRAMLAEAVSRLSGAKVFALDEMSILEPALRVDCIRWLDCIAEHHETIIVAATLREAPTGLPGSIQTLWLGAETNATSRTRHGSEPEHRFV